MHTLAPSHQVLASAGARPRGPGRGPMPLLPPGLDAPSSFAQLEALQRTVGNAVVQRLWSAMAEAGSAAAQSGALAGAPPVARRLAATAGRGRALEAGVRRSLEGAMGVDLGEVRIHDDAEAAALARDTGAEAFTSGRDIYLGGAGHRPHTTEGLRTLAHEAAHVVQQSRGPVPGTLTADGVRVSDPHDAEEQAAERVADDVVAGRAAGTGLGASRGAPGAPADGPAAVQRACACGGGAGGCGCGPSAGGGSGELDRDEAPALQRLASPGATPVVQRKKLAVGDLDVDMTPRVVLSAAFQAPGGRVETLRGIPVDDAGHGVAQLSEGEEAVGLDITETISWRSGSRPPGPVPPGPVPGLPGIPVPPALQAACNPCLILLSGPVQTAIQFAPKSVRDMARDCTTRKTFAERRDFVENFLRLVTADPCLLLTESPAKINLSSVPIIGPLLGTVGLADACRVASNIPVVSNIVNGVSSGLRVGLNLLRNLPAEAVCKNITPVDPPDPNRPASVGNAVVRFTTRFVTEGGRLQPFGPSPISNLNGSGATLEQPVSSGRTQAGTGANLFLAPALLRAGTPDRGQDLVDIDVKPPAPPTPVDARCTDRFFPFVTSQDRFEDDAGEVTRIHTFFHGLNPKVKRALADGKGQLEIIGRASKSGSVQFNLGLAAKRAKRVETELQRAAGSDAHLRTSSTGNLAAVLPGNAPEERRADVIVTVRLEGESARGVTPETACVGGSISDTLIVEAPAPTEETTTAPLPEAPAPDTTGSEPAAPGTEEAGLPAGLEELFAGV